MKKTTKTTKASPAPAPASATITASAPAPKRSKAPRLKPPAPPAATNGAAEKPVAAPVTIITAKIDVGFGNRIFVRGEGPGLSWDKGTAMDCIADDRWVLSLSGVSKTVVFKFLLNDESWSIGDDYLAEPGSSFSKTPLF